MNSVFAGEQTLGIAQIYWLSPWHEFFFEVKEKWHKSILIDMNSPHGIACAALLNKEKVHNSCIHDCLFNAEQLIISWTVKNRVSLHYG